MATPPSSNLNQKTTPDSRPRGTTGLRRLFPIFISRTASGTHVEIRWKHLLLSLLLLGVIGWLGAASSIYFFVKYRRGFTEVSFTHMLLLPIKWDEYNNARGNFYIQLAEKELAAQKFQQAFAHLSVGVAKAPENRKGRMLLAQFYVLYKRPDISQRVLLEGIPYGKDDPDYLKSVFTFLLQQQDDEEVMKLSERLLQGETAPTDRNRLVALARATASFHRGNYDVAEDAIRTFKLNEMRDGLLLGIRIKWETGEKEAALGTLRALTEQYPADEEIYAQLVSYLREQNRDSEVRRVSLLRQMAFPQSARPRIDLLYVLDKEGDIPRLNRNIEEIFAEFSSNSDAMLALADFAANTGRPDLARRIYEHCKANDLNWEGPALMTVEAHVVAKEYQAALENTQLMLKENPEWGKRYYSVFNGLQAIANFGLGDTESGQLFLSNFLNQSNVRADNLVAVSNRLISVGARAQARRVLAQAVSSDPLNQAALVGLIKLDTEMGNADNLPANVRRLLAMRKPPTAPLENAYRTLGSDRYLFAPDRAALLDDLREAISVRERDA